MKCLQPRRPDVYIHYNHGLPWTLSDKPTTSLADVPLSDFSPACLVFTVQHSLHLV